MSTYITQFNNLPIYDDPDPSKLYYYDKINQTSNFTFIHKLVLNQYNEHVLKTCLGFDTSQIDAQTTNGLTPLMMAVNLGYTNIVTILINAGADVNITTSNNENALHILCHAAFQKQHVNIAKLLIDANINTCLINNDDESPIYIALNNKRQELSNLLLEYSIPVINHISKSNYTILGLACISKNDKNEKLIKQLINIGADINTNIGKFNYPIIHYAIINNNPKITDLLIESGCLLTNLPDETYHKLVEMHPKYQPTITVIQLLANYSQMYNKYNTPNKHNLLDIKADLKTNIATLQKIYDSIQ